MILTKQQVVAKIADVASMNETELDDFSVAVSTSNADAKAKFFIYKAIDLRREEIVSLENAKVVPGDTDDIGFE